MIDRQLIGNYVEGKDRGLIWNIAEAFTWEKAWKFQDYQTLELGIVQGKLNVSEFEPWLRAVTAVQSIL
jgi:uncharacterized iron-regulated protein